MMSEKSILHADMDAFFASVEQLENPSYRGRPVIVGGTTNRGVVSAASYEARKFGVHSAMPMWQARQLCPHGIVVHPRGHLYGDYSRRVMAIFLSYTPRLDPVSIDEAYLDITGTERLFGPPLEVAKQLKARVRAEVGLTVSIGMARNRMLAKLASDWDKPDGLFWIRSEDLPEILDSIPVAKLAGIGRVTQERLHYIGVNTAGQLRQMPLKLLEREFGQQGLHLYRTSRGEGSNEVCFYEEREGCKQVSEEMTFENDTRDADLLRLRLLETSDNLARRLRRQRLCGRTVTLKVKYSDFKQITRSSTLPHPTDGWQEIYEVARELLAHVDLAARSIRLIGVGVSNLTRDCGYQLSLFDEGPAESRALDRAVDELIARFGRGTVCQARRKLKPDSDQVEE